MTPSLGDLLVRHEAELRRWIAQHAGIRLLRYEGLDDLVQGCHVKALKLGASFEYQGPGQFFAWLFQLAEFHLSARRRYWSAQRRDTARVIRLLEVETGGFDVPASNTSPSSGAARRELIRLVAKAVAGLPERDQRLISLAAHGASSKEIASELGLTPKTAKQARLRAIDRLAKMCRLLSKRWSTRRDGPAADR